jgi:SAM-dependent methyltransferase
VRNANVRSPLAVYAAALHRAAAGGHTRLLAVDPAGGVRSFVTGEWCGGLRAGDEGLLRRCTGWTLDVGCGPGRLTGALADRGLVALGIDMSATAVRLARRRGAHALRRDVFAPVPQEGRWRRVLLVDGNIGISGDPQRLLCRCRQLARPDGEVLVELDPPGSRTWVGELRLHAAGGGLSGPFPWAYLSAEDLARPARAAGLRVRDAWTEAGRWFASLSRG